MASKDYCFLNKKDVIYGEVSTDQYSNLNLNHNYQSFDSEKVRSKSVINISRKVQNYGTTAGAIKLTDLNNLQSKNDLNLWNKSSKHLSPNFLNLSHESEEQQELKKSKSANNSTLSLHIAAYENSIETSNDLNGAKKEDSEIKYEKTDLIKKWETLKQGFSDSSSFNQNPFEFPRQQEDQNKNPEVMQFKASQQLLNSNEEHLNVNERINIIEPSIVQSNHLPTTADILQKSNHRDIGDSPFSMSAQRHQSKNESGNGGTTVGTPRSPSKGLYVLSKNQKKLRLPLYMVRQCHTLECVLDVFDDTFNDPLPLPITEECLNFVFNYARYFADDLRPYKRPLRNKLFPLNFDRLPYAKLLYSLDLQHLAITFKAADYLQFDRLLDDITKCLMFHLNYEYTDKENATPPWGVSARRLNKKWVNQMADKENHHLIVCNQAETPKRPIFFCRPAI